ncbi:MAG: hypothetical protein K5787_13005 [Lentisphaeria bacterium]|nr:hypothetical protein [Lentisphaeria bacterium]
MQDNKNGVLRRETPFLLCGGGNFSTSSTVIEAFKYVFDLAAYQRQAEGLLTEMMPLMMREGRI